MKVMNHKVTDLFTPKLFMLQRLGQNENRRADRVIAARRQSRWIVECTWEMSRPSINNLMPFWHPARRVELEVRHWRRERRRWSRVWSRRRRRRVLGDRDQNRGDALIGVGLVRRGNGTLVQKGTGVRIEAVTM
jgi:hypothetical protein